MIADVRAVLWKELREILLPRGRPSWNLVSVLIMVVVAGVGFPVVSGLVLPPLGRRALLGFFPQAALFSLPFVAFFAGIAVVVDAIAGERERHTLETLLASPLGDRSILAGKVLALTLFAWATGVVELILHLATLLALYGPDRIRIPAPDALVGFLLVGLAAALLLTVTGFLVSMHASTVRQGQQILATILLPVFLLLPFGSILLRVDWIGEFARWIAGHGLGGGSLWTALFLSLVDAALVAAAVLLFRRPRLLLT